MSKLKAGPFPYFGGKSRVIQPVWERLGADATVYLEPFCGSAAMLLGRPARLPLREVINDINGFVANFWRSLKHDPEGVLDALDGPVVELDLYSRNEWLIANSADIVTRLEGDPEYYDSKIAGWWCWGQCLWIGSGWARNLTRQIPHLPDMTSKGPRGILSHDEKLSILTQLSLRLRKVTVTCGDWRRILGSSTADRGNGGSVAVFLDPPYPAGGISYGHGDERAVELSVHEEVREWCVERGADPWMRIALCGYEEHAALADHGWTPYRWKATSGGALSSKDGDREVIWFSPHCLSEAQQTLMAWSVAGGR